MDPHLIKSLGDNANEIFNILYAQYPQVLISTLIHNAHFLTVLIIVDVLSMVLLLYSGISSRKHDRPIVYFISFVLFITAGFILKSDLSNYMLLKSSPKTYLINKINENLK